jgi:hypothetical protein
MGYTPYRRRYEGSDSNEKREKVILEFQNGDVEISMIEKEHLGNYRYYVCPAGVIPVEKVPEGWGLLEVHRGRDIHTSVFAKVQEKNWKSEQNILISVLRRLNIAKDDHVAIQRFTVDGFLGVPSKKRATFYIDNENTEGEGI